MMVDSHKMNKWSQQQETLQRVETSTLSSVQQRRCEEFVPDVQSKLKAVRMFLIAASWTAGYMVRLHASVTE